jgi:glycogen debranching enzyme
MSREQTMPDSTLDIAYRLMEDAVVSYGGNPIGTVAARDPDGPVADNYLECFVRDFAVSALVYLADCRYEPVRNFLATVVSLLDQELSIEGYEIQPGVMPASFRVTDGDGRGERLVADFGNRAIGRVAPVDSMMWWVLVLHAYVTASGDREFARRHDIQSALCSILSLCLKGSFEVYPTLLVPDASCMIDRRMGVYGHPLEIQALFYGMLHTAAEMCEESRDSERLLRGAVRRRESLRDYVRSYYWLDVDRLNEVHRYRTEEFGDGGVNMLNINPESLPQWIEHWLPESGGYLVGNLGPERMDVRFFALGNLLAILFDLATDRQAQGIMALYEARWDDLVGAMPVKICYPALEGQAWRVLTGGDPKNVPWSYHNGGNWPVLLWPFVAAALKTERRELAERAVETAAAKLARHQWPEYYDGRSGRLIGRRANLNQTWSAAAYIFARKLLDKPTLLSLFPG